MLNTKLNPCADLLYHWLLIYKNQAKSSPFNLVTFQIWTSEFLPKSARKNKVLEAISVLKTLGVVTVDNQFLYINQEKTTINQYISQLPTYYLLEKKLRN